MVVVCAISRKAHLDIPLFCNIVRQVTAPINCFTQWSTRDLGWRTRPISYCVRGCDVEVARLLLRTMV